MDDFQGFVLLKHAYGGTVHQASRHHRGRTRHGENRGLRSASQVQVCSCVELEAILPCTVHLLDSHRQPCLLLNAVASRLLLSPIYFLPGQTANHHLGWPQFSSSASLVILSPQGSGCTSPTQLTASSCWLASLLASWMLGRGHCLFSLLCVQLVLEETPVLLLRISQPWSLLASWQAE